VTSTPLLDTNVLLRHLLQDHADHSPRATRFFERVEAGEMQVRLSDLVVFETIFTMQRLARVPRDLIRDRLQVVLSAPGMVFPGRERWLQVLDLYADSGLSIADAYHAVMMQRLRIGEIASFDRDFDGIAGIVRIEP
jgi:predicted nucleic acid-binding protein